MAAKFKVGDRVLIASITYLSTGKNPYIIGGWRDTEAADERLKSVADQEAEVLAVHPAGFLRLDCDCDTNMPGCWMPDMVTLVRPPMVEPKTHPAGTEFPIQEAAIAIMAGMLANHGIIPHEISDEQARKIAKNVLKLAKALELELQ